MRSAFKVGRYISEKRVVAAGQRSAAEGSTAERPEKKQVSFVDCFVCRTRRRGGRGLDKAPGFGSEGFCARSFPMVTLQRGQRDRR
jgi:hypothetical protein